MLINLPQTSVMAKVDPTPNFDLVLKKIEAELKEAIALARTS